MTLSKQARLYAIRLILDMFQHVERGKDSMVYAISCLVGIGVSIDQVFEAHEAIDPADINKQNKLAEELLKFSEVAARPKATELGKLTN